MVEEHSTCQLSMTMWTCVPEYCHGRRALPLSAFHDDVDVCAGVLSW